MERTHLLNYYGCDYIIFIISQIALNWRWPYINSGFLITCKWIPERLEVHAGLGSPLQPLRGFWGTGASVRGPNSQFETKSQNVMQCTVYSSTSVGRQSNSGTLAPNGQNTASPNYNDDISLVISTIKMPLPTYTEKILVLIWRNPDPHSKPR
jgi:hypothetical protein